MLVKDIFYKGMVNLDLTTLVVCRSSCHQKGRLECIRPPKSKSGTEIVLIKSVRADLSQNIYENQ